MHFSYTAHFFCRPPLDAQPLPAPRTRTLYVGLGQGQLQVTAIRLEWYCRKVEDRMGLVLNSSKFWTDFPSWLWHTGRHIAFVPPCARQVEESSLFGAPLFVGPALDDAWSKASDDLIRAVDKLRNIGSQEALILLRASSFSAPRVLHLLRCSSLKDHPGLVLCLQMFLSLIVISVYTVHISFFLSLAYRSDRLMDFFTCASSLDVKSRKDLPFRRYTT